MRLQRSICNSALLSIGDFKGRGYSS